jgi:hypothetical protein
VRRPSYSSFFFSCVFAFLLIFLASILVLAAPFLTLFFAWRAAASAALLVLAAPFLAILSVLGADVGTCLAVSFCCLYGLPCCLSRFFNYTSCIACYTAVSDLLSCITNFFRSISCYERSFLYRLCKL